MPMPVRSRAQTKSEPCECGDVMEWCRSRAYRGPVRYRQECICGRCGPWRSKPEYEPSGPPDMPRYGASPPCPTGGGEVPAKK